jgi:hypothetical protein
MISLLAVATGGNLGPFAPIAPYGTDIVYLIAFICAIAGMVVIGHAGTQQATGRAVMGALVMEYFMGVIVLCVAGGLTVIGTTVAGAVTI